MPRVAPQPKHPIRPLLALVLLAFAHPARAQEQILLRLHPKVGDTLHTLLEQQMEVSMPPTSAGGAGRSTVTSVTIHSETIVRAVQATSTIVFTIVDSARLTSTDAHAAAAVASAQRALEGQQLVLQLGAD